MLTTRSLVICGDGGVFTDESGRKGARLRAYGLDAQSERPELQVDPLLGNPQAIAAGQILYNQNCAVCHGTGARGDRGPSLVSGNFQHGGTDGEILLSIRAGVRGTEMPSFARSLPIRSGR